jgi:hypothetical protein
MNGFTRALLVVLSTLLATLAVGSVTAVLADVWDINGTSGPDYMDGHWDVDKFHGLGGADELLGHGAGDKLYGGGPGGDVLRGMENGDDLDNFDGYANDKGYCGDGGDNLVEDSGDQSDSTCENVDVH